MAIRNCTKSVTTTPHSPLTLSVSTFTSAGTAGARDSFKNVRYVPDGTADQMLDLDTPEEYRRWRASA